MKIQLNEPFKSVWNPLRTKHSRFVDRRDTGSSQHDIRLGRGRSKQKLKKKRDNFSWQPKTKDYNFMFSLQELQEKIGDNPKCYLTGKEIALTKSRSYSLDHIVPRSKGGDNSLDNCGLVCAEANQAKHALTLEEFISLCESVVNNFKN